MLNQLNMDLFTYLLNYLPILLTIVLNIIILVFGFFIYKRNSYKYGITIMVSSILLLVSNVIYIAIQYPYLTYRLFVELGLPASVVYLILTTWSIVFLSLGVSSMILLVVSVYLIYKTHKKERIE